MRKSTDLANQLRKIENELINICSDMKTLVETFQRTYPALPPRPGWMLKKVTRPTGQFEPSKIYWGKYFYFKNEASEADKQRGKKYKYKFAHSKERQDKFPAIFSKKKDKELRAALKEFHTLKNKLNARRADLMETWEIVRNQLAGYKQRDPKKARALRAEVKALRTKSNALIDRRGRQRTD